MFKSPLFGQEEFSRLAKTGETVWLTVALVGGLTTAELSAEYSERSKRRLDPGLIVAICDALLGEFSRRIESHEICYRKPNTWRNFETPNVDAEIAWLPILKNVVLRAKVAQASFLQNSMRERELTAARSNDAQKQSPNRQNQAIEIFPVFNISIEQPANDKPMRVEIVGMPDRQTEVILERDEHDNIVSTSHFERDAEQHA